MIYEILIFIRELKKTLQAIGIKNDETTTTNIVMICI
jgi:hypothetical protein